MIRRKARRSGVTFQVYGPSIATRQKIYIGSFADEEQAKRTEREYLARVRAAREAGRSEALASRIEKAAPMTSPWLHQLGVLLKQAEKRLGEIDGEHARLDEERAQILAAFPQLKKARAYTKKPPAVLFDAAKADDSKPTNALGHEPFKKYTAEQKAVVVERIRNGETVGEVCRSVGLAHDSQVREWCKAAGVTPPPGRIDAQGLTLEWMRSLDRPVTIRECAEHFQITRKGTAEMRLRTLDREGYARRVGPGTFELTSKGKGGNGSNGTHPKRPAVSESHRVATAGKGLAPEVVAKVREMIDGKQANARIAKTLGIGKSTVRRIREQGKREAQS